MQARTNGHLTKHLTSWGHDCDYDRSSNLHANYRSSRRMPIPPPSTETITRSLRGEGLEGSASEPMILAKGQTVNLRSAPEPSPRRATPWATDDELSNLRPGNNVLYDSVSGASHATVNPRRRVDSLATGSLVPYDEDSRQAHCDAAEHKQGEHTPLPLPTPCDDCSDGEHLPYRLSVSTDGKSRIRDVTAPQCLSAEVIDAVTSLTTALADRHISWLEAFAPYDHRGCGFVSTDDMLRIFRAAGLSPSTSLLRFFSAPYLTPQGVDYRALRELAPATLVQQGLQSSTTATIHSSRRHMLNPGGTVVGDTTSPDDETAPCGIPHGQLAACRSISAHAQPQTHVGEQVAERLGPQPSSLILPHDTADSHRTEIEHLTVQRRLHRILTERCQMLNRSPHELWAELHPCGGVATIRGLNDGLNRIGLPLGENDFYELVGALTTSRSCDPRQGTHMAGATPVITWEVNLSTACWVESVDDSLSLCAWLACSNPRMTL